MSLLREFTPNEISTLARQFADASPFPHLVVDDLIRPEARELLSGFPDSSWIHWERASEGYQKAKHTCADITKIPSAYAALIRECNEPAFLTSLEAITGIRQIIADPYLEGGGLHASSEGGVLVPHTDFHYYERLHMFRMINLIIYVTDEWSEADGGGLELYRRGESKPDVSIIPRFGRAVIFKTDDKSIHGFTKPVAAGKWRTSVAIYYYQSRESADFSGDTTTYWQSTGTKLKGPRLAAFRALTFISRSFSKLAHKIDPNV